jgi:hypothetical protein
MEKFGRCGVSKNSRFVFALPILAAGMIFGNMLAPLAFAQPVHEPTSKPNVSQSTAETIKTDSTQDPRILVEKLVNSGIEFAKAGQYHQSRFEFIGALKQVYPVGTDYVVMSDKKSKTLLLGENNDAIVYAHFFQDKTKDSFEIQWKNHI